LAGSVFLSEQYVVLQRRRSARTSLQHKTESGNLTTLLPLSVYLSILDSLKFFITLTSPFRGYKLTRGSASGMDHAKKAMAAANAAMIAANKAEQKAKSLQEVSFYTRVVNGDIYIYWSYQELLPCLIKFHHSQIPLRSTYCNLNCSNVSLGAGTPCAIQQIIILGDLIQE
jgi:hypothetical protein